MKTITFRIYLIKIKINLFGTGAEELMRGVGKDATKLFDEVHAWVNYEQLLKKCLIGPLQRVQINTEYFKPLKINPEPPQAIISLEKIPTKVIPRFDWIQKLSDLTLCLYTKQYCNPGVVLKRNNAKNIEMRTCIANCWYRHSFELHDEVSWPPTMAKISSESGKIEINLTKTKTYVWPSFGTLNESIEQQLEDSFYESEIVQCQSFNHNSFALLLRVKYGTIILAPVGYHLTFSCNIEGENVIRSYTPVPIKYSPISRENFTDLHFLLKTYEKGLLASFIKNMQPKSNILVSQPKGNFVLNKFLGHTRIALFAAGSGITPMLSIIDHLLARNKLRIEKLILMFFNKTDEDVWCKTTLEEIMKSDPRLEVKHIFSQQTDKVDREDRHISKELLTKIQSPSSEIYSTFVCGCGPPAFNTLTESIFKSLHFSPTNMYFFHS